MQSDLKTMLDIATGILYGLSYFITLLLAAIWILAAMYGGWWPGYVLGGANFICCWALAPHLRQKLHDWINERRADKGLPRNL